MNSNASQVQYVDLTKDPATPSAPSAPLPAAVADTIFIDLTKGTTPTAPPAPPPQTPAVRTRHIDLSQGGIESQSAELSDLLPDSEQITVTAGWLNDPYEAANRRRFGSHVGLHRYAIDPVERGYIALVPGDGRSVVHSFLTNLDSPSVLFNDLFQGHLDRAGDTLSRFVVNSTLGIGGLLDIAGMAGMNSRDNDFGATLATYGVDDYPYLLVPVIGPTNPRDLGGKLIDFLLNPLRWVTLPGGIVTSVFHVGLNELDKRSVGVGDLDMLAKTAPDAYAVERGRALERRAAELSDTPPKPVR